MNDHESFGLGISRRDFIQSAAVAMAATATAVRTSTSHAAIERERPLIDTNVYLGAWPFRHASRETPELLKELRDKGVTQAWAGSLDALLHKDIASVNARLADDCKRHGEGWLTPIGAVNPMLPAWEEDLRRCHEKHRMPGIRLHPNYHSYKLSDPGFERVLEVAQKRELFVQIAVLMEEERTIHPLVNVPPVDTGSLTTVLPKFPKLRVQLLNALGGVLKAAQMDSLAQVGVRFDIAMLEGLIGVEKLLEKVPMSCLCFGSYAPVFYFDSAQLKLKESDLAGAQMKSLCWENALRLTRAS